MFFCVFNVKLNILGGQLNFKNHQPYPSPPLTSSSGRQDSVHRHQKYTDRRDKPYERNERRRSRSRSPYDGYRSSRNGNGRSHRDRR